MSGDLLVMVSLSSVFRFCTTNSYPQAAEANMSLGNVMYARTNETYYQHAIGYLRRTTGIPGYDLPHHLQR